MPIAKEKVRKIKRTKRATREKADEILNESSSKLFDTFGEYKYVPHKLKKFCVSMSRVSLLEKNPRINDKAAEKLAILIKENGFRKPIVIDQNGKVMAGNTAYKAARLLDMKFIPAAESDFAGEADAMRYVISDNKASEYSYWDEEMLKELVASQQLDDKDVVRGLGLSDADMKKLFNMKEEKKIKSIMEVVASVDSEDEAEELFNELRERGYSCRVLAL